MMDRHKQSIGYALGALQNPKFSGYVQEVYLFGSCARGEQKYKSDVDLLVCVAGDTPPRVMRQIRCETAVEDIHLPEVDIKFATGKNFSSSRQFNENIKRDGKLLWRRN